jgi:hypothetical protein
MQSPIIGKVYFSTSPVAVQYALNSRFLIGILSDTLKPSNMQEFCASTLLPPPESCFATLEQGIEIGVGIYKQYLMTKTDLIEPVLCNIIGSIISRPSNILLFVEKDPNEQFKILPTLAEFFYNTFGIVPGYIDETGKTTNEFSTICNVNTNANIADLLYRNNLLSNEQYSMIFPKHMLPSIKSCGILLKSMNYGFQTIEEYQIYCRKMLDEIYNNKVNGTFNPMVNVTNKS